MNKIRYFYRGATKIAEMQKYVEYEYVLVSTYMFLLATFITGLLVARGRGDLVARGLLIAVSTVDPNQVV